MAGIPYLMRIIGFGLRGPKTPVPGLAVAGTVEAVGQDVTGLAPGDEVFGTSRGSFAEYAVARASRLAPKPARLTFEQAAAVPVSAAAALQAVRDHARVRPGQHVLVIGASGGVGTFAVQIAKAFGAEVTGVCSPRNVELVRSIGADHVIDYTKEDFTEGSRRYDLLLDVAGNHVWSEYKRILEPNGTHVRVGGPKTNRVIGPLGQVLRLQLSAVPSSQKTTFFIANPNKADLLVLSELIESGKVTPVIDRRYELAEVADALEYLGAGHARGKVVVTV
jgi:NADPH:quinone reductase-like Zn-dependent oxidoreductase